MENWGIENFANQGARAYLDSLALKLVATIHEVFADPERLELDEDGEAMFMPSVELLALLCERYGVNPPKPDSVEQWRIGYLTVYDRDIETLSDDAGFRDERRKIVERTFAWLMGLSESYWQ